MSLFTDAIASTASTLTADGMTTDEIAAKMAGALTDLAVRLGALDVSSLTKLADNAIYVLYSGPKTGQAKLASDFVKSVSNAGTIGNTAWGRDLIANLTDTELQQSVNVLNNAFEGKLRFEGNPININTIKDIYWNYGSPAFVRNGGSPGSVVRAFIGADADPARGFGSLELPIAMAEQIPINGAVPASFEDALARSAAFGAAEEASLIAERAAHAVIPASRVMEIENDSRFRQIVSTVQKWIGDLTANGVDVAGQSLAQIERAYVAAFKASTAKMAEFAAYGEARAKLMIDLIQSAGAAVPAVVRAGIQKAADYYKTPDGSINKTKIGLTVASSVLALADLWVEADKRGGFFTPAFGAYLKETLKDVAQSIATPSGVAIIAAGFTPLGPAMLFSLGAVAAYSSIRKVLDYVVDTYGQEDGFIKSYVAPVRDWFVQFEHKIQPYLDTGSKWLTSGVEHVLESVTSSSIEWVGGQSATPITTANEIAIGDDASIIQGNNLDNWLVHRGAGEVHGATGEDVLVGWFGDVIKPGEALDRITRDKERAAQAAYEDAIRKADPTATKPVLDSAAVRADHEYTLTLDGGEGNDWVVAIGGEKVTTIGGEGEDFIFNSSLGGKIYGDSIDGTGTRSRDVIWWSPGTFLMDAGPEDSLQFFGLPLTGGSGTKKASGEEWAYDWVVKFVRYGLTDSGQLIVQSSLGDILNHVIRGGDDILATSMIVQKFNQGEGGNWAHIAKGDLGMTFRMYDRNAENKWGGFESVWGMLSTLLDAVNEYGKQLHWLSPDDPLVLDLDGDGIETTERDFEGVHFDFNGDSFAELSGWIGADDGFLVLDRDGNGKIDDISELFGAPGGSGFAELRAVDEDATGLADGRIDASDVVFSRLQVWRDLNQDGVLQQGELFSLSDLGIVSIDAVGDALNVTSPSGALLRDKASFTRADGSTGNVFEAIFETNPIDTVFADDRGTAGWAARGADGAVIDDKGFGLLGDLSVALSNDIALNETVTSVAASMTTRRRMRQERTGWHAAFRRSSGRKFFKVQKSKIRWGVKLQATSLSL